MKDKCTHVVLTVILRAVNDTEPGLTARKIVRSRTYSAPVPSGIWYIVVAPPRPVSFPSRFHSIDDIYTA